MKEHVYQIQVCLRPFTPQEVQQRQQEVLDRIEALAADGVVEPTVVWWSPKVCPPGTDNPLSSGCPDIVAELIDLADSKQFSLEPFIQEHHGITPDDDSLVLPVICLVVRDGGEIGGLYPVSLEGTKYTVEDGLRALESGEAVLNLG
jgi:hypothetical protein